MLDLDSDTEVRLQRATKGRMCANGRDITELFSYCC